MKFLKTGIMFVVRFFIFIGIPLGLIYILNVNYPGLLSERYLSALHLAMYLGVPIIIFYLLSDIWSGWKKMVAELISLSLVLVYTLLLLGFGKTEIYYENVNMEIVYSLLLYVVVIGVLVRFPTPVFRYLAEREERKNLPEYS